MKKGETCKKAGEVSQRLILRGPTSMLSLSKCSRNPWEGETWSDLGFKRSLCLQCGRVLEGAAWRQGDGLGGSGPGQVTSLRPEGLVQMRNVQEIKWKKLVLMWLGGKRRENGGIWACPRFLAQMKAILYSGVQGSKKHLEDSPLKVILTCQQ